MKTCSIEGCKDQTKAKGYCSKHYQRFRIHGDPLHTKHPGRDSELICMIAGCDYPVKAKGFCNNHYRRYWKYNDPLYIKKYDRDLEKLPCKVNGCEKHVCAKGFCSTHYQRFRIHGDPLHTTKRRYNMSLKETMFWCLTQTKKGGPKRYCMEWIKYKTPAGYGEVSFQGKKILVGQLILTYFQGDSNGRHMLHLCDNKTCINSDHLNWGSAGENVIHRMIRGPRNIKCKLNSDNIKDIRILSKNGLQQKIIAKQFNVAPNTISAILSGKSWSYILDDTPKPEHPHEHTRRLRNTALPSIHTARRNLRHLWSFLPDMDHAGQRVAP